MAYLIVLFYCFLHIAFTLDFTLSTGESKLLTWLNMDGIEEKLLLSQLVIDKKTGLVERATLPYEYLVEDNCIIT